jgi:ESS family glutamate:Na+ symporter
MLLQLDAVQTLAFAGLTLFVGYGVRRVFPVLGRYNLPPPIIGGLLVALAILLAHGQGTTLLKFDTTLQSPLMIAFFTSIGLGASLSLLRAGGPQVVLLLVVSTIFAIAQNVLGILVAGAFAGSVTLTGGPATGLAFAPLFEQAGIAGAGSIALAMAMAGIVSGGLVGGPVGTFLIERYRLRGQRGQDAPPSLPSPASGGGMGGGAATCSDADVEHSVLKNVVVILVAMWLGAWISRGCAALGLTFPATIGAMLAGGAIRNLDDATGWIGLSQSIVENVGAAALALFLVVALMTLELWNLAGLALPLIAILVLQIVLVALLCCWPIFQILGKDYPSAVTVGGFIGFMLGTTANAMAVMRTLVERYGPAPRAFFVAPMVGAFFIDFANALIITACLNIYGR